MQTNSDMGFAVLARWLILPLLLFFASESQSYSQNVVNSLKGQSGQKKSGTAVVITGAAAKIPQEAALLEQLYNTGWLKNVAFISGASSGTLNSVVLNSILSGNYSWSRYRQALFRISNRKVYIKEPKLPFNTTPLHNLLVQIVNDSLGFETMGDLPVPTAISATNIEVIPLKKKMYRFSNLPLNPESNPRYNLVDVLMASTAIPLVFPPVRIHNGDDFPSVTFVDGGIADDHIPLEAVLEFQSKTSVRIDTLIIVSRKMDSQKDLMYELNNLGLKDSKGLIRLGLTLQKYSFEAFIDRLILFREQNPELAAHTFVYIPAFSEDFPMLDFDNMRSQYESTTKWARQNYPVPLSLFLEHNPAKSIKAKSNE